MYTLETVHSHPLNVTSGHQDDIEGYPITRERRNSYVDPLSFNDTITSNDKSSIFSTKSRCFYIHILVHSYS